jgi:hypothetical protein
LIAKALLATEPSTAEGGIHGLLAYTAIVANLLNPAGLAWGAAHLFAEVGPPLLFGGFVLAIACVLQGDWRALIVLSVGMVPSLAVYLANPSPPRHFYVVTVALACFIAVTADAAHLRTFRILTPVFLVLNLVTPWALTAADGRSLPDRGIVTYNVIERTDRNQTQIREAFAFYDRLIDAVDGRPIVVFGSWVHLAQLTSALVSDPTLTLQRTQLLPGLTAMSLTRADLQVYFVETYDPGAVKAASDSLASSRPDLLRLSLVESITPVNDVGLVIPPEIRWWTS